MSFMLSNDYLNPIIYADEFANPSLGLCLTSVSYANFYYILYCLSLISDSDKLIPLEGLP